MVVLLESLHFGEFILLLLLSTQLGQFIDVLSFIYETGVLILIEAQCLFTVSRPR